MTESLNLSNEEMKEVPKTAKGRLKVLNELSVKEKLNFLPHSGFRFALGPYVYQVAVVNPGKLRFTAKLIDVIIEGVNDGKSKIINPHTGDPVDKNLINTKKDGRV